MKIVTSADPWGTREQLIQQCDNLEVQHTAILDALYAKYGEHVANAERTTHNTRMAYHDKADGVLTAIRIIEGITGRG